MSSTYGENLHLTIFGQSHSPAIGVTVEGIPAGEKVDLDELQRFLKSAERRRPSTNFLTTLGITSNIAQTDVEQRTPTMFRPTIRRTNPL